MPVHNAEIADLFETLADLLEIEGANAFRVRAYRNAARTVRGHGQSMESMLARGEDLTRLAGIGRDLAQKIDTIVKTGKLPLLVQVEARVPAALSELMRIRGLGPKRVKALSQRLKIRTVDDLRRALRSGKVRALPGFGDKTVSLIMEHMEQPASADRRTRLIDAHDLVTPLLEYLRGIEGVGDVTVAGSFRRRSATVGDLDILVSASQRAPVMERFLAYDEVHEVSSRGKTRSTVYLRSGMQVDLRLVPKASQGAALQYFTGSKAHNIALRTIAQAKKLKLNEYGLFRGERRIAGRTEAEIYAKLGLDYIEPELRENRGEVEAARAGTLPKLISLRDMRGDLHCHTRASDGQHSLEEMVQAARARGYAYLSINDHSQRLRVARGLDERRLRAQIERIDRLNESLDGFVVLKSVEVDILEDGRLDLADGVLAELDLTVCAVHSGFRLSRERQTERIIRAMDNPHVNILAHPTGGLIGKRAPYDVDLERLMKAAKERGCVMELNAQPDRLDLDDVQCRAAKALGVKLAISTDAHSAANLDYMRFGIDQARRGWLQAKDVINTRSVSALRRLLRR